ncbi:NIPSNAP family protein [Montanilutibacter psychrotolerans]|uniref:NIPSNAP family protein n=1 Tax=Montanilutibacter psychrotolerans TaxID=1327343 RepID=A0A3M8SS42_9GAMM|nr:NIPSNAP family protein [Lysobacter psychrotolerans]RNF83593.1 NIPSNAP family protein [Lysobacter psychrotolerans]
MNNTSIPDALPVGPDSCGSDAANECSVVELRQYTLHPGMRDVLIELFDRAFVESQEALGMALFGQFRIPDNPDMFVWLRGFADMSARPAALAGFYTGPIWQTHRNEANATMVDSDNVLLLRPAWAGSGLRLAKDRRAGHGASAIPPGLVDITVFPLAGPADEKLLAFCRDSMTAALARGGAHDIAWYITEETANNFPKLPVRTGEYVLVGIAVFRDAVHYETFVNGGSWDQEVSPTLEPRLAGATQSMQLQPTARSALHL